MPRDANRVAEISTSTGNGNLTLAGATPGHRTFATALGSSGSPTVYYGILHATDGSWEVGIGAYLSASNALQRNTVLDSSSGGSKISFASGQKVAYITMPAENPLTVRIRRPGDIGVEVIPASGQTALMIRTANTAGNTVFGVNVAGEIITNAQWQIGRGTDTVNNLVMRPPATDSQFKVSNVNGDAALAMIPDARKFGLSAGQGSGLTIFTGTGSLNFCLGGYATDTVDARVTTIGKDINSAQAIVTREKGDNRYQLSSSSASLKKHIAVMEDAEIDLSGLVPKVWIWDMDGHPRNERSGAGFIYEEVLEVFETATYPGNPGGIDALALLAGFVVEARRANRALSDRITALEEA